MEGNEYLFEANKDLIPKVAKKFYGYGKLGIEYEDLYQEASLALHLATVNFEEARWGGKPFRQFAVTFMYQCLMVFLSRQNTLYTPRKIVVLAGKIRREELTETPAAAIAKKFGETEWSVKQALKHLKGVYLVGIDSEITVGTKTLNYADILPDKDIMCVTEHTSLQMFRETLKGRESAVFELMIQDRSNRHIEDTLGLTRSNVNYAVKLLRQKYKKITEII